MKINYNNTALEFLDNPMRFNFYIPEDTTPKLTDQEARQFGMSLREAYRNKLVNYKKNIQLITQPFYKAYQSARGKIKETVLSETFEDCGTLIIPWPSHTQTIFYVITTNGKTGDDWDFNVIMTLFTKSPHTDIFGLDLFTATGKSMDDGKPYNKEIIWDGFIREKRDTGWWIADILLLKTFLKYCEVETKIVAPGKKVEHVGEKHKNDTRYKVEILDSTYFTTISRTEGFGVKGHFRMQPYGHGLSSKRLQWISEFQKQGYTRRAKIDR
jgi:hypothetical protein